MATKGPVNQQNINHGTSAFSPVEPNNSSSPPPNLGYVLPSWSEWMSNWPWAMRTVENFQIRNQPPSHAYGRSTPFFNHLGQYNADVLAHWAQQQYCPKPPNYQQQQYYSNDPQQTSSMDHSSDGAGCNNNNNTQAAGSNSSYSFNYQNMRPPPSYYSNHHHNNINNTTTGQNHDQPMYSSSFISHDSTTSTDDGTFIDVDSLSSSDDEDNSFNPVIISVVGSPMPNDSDRTTSHSSAKQDCENLLKILVGVEEEATKKVDADEEKARRIATEVLCSKFGLQKFPPSEQNIQISDCILTKENATAAISTNNKNKPMAKKTQNHTVIKTGEKSVMNVQKKKDGKKERNKLVTKTGEEGQRSSSKETLCSTGSLLNKKTSDSSAENNNKKNDDTHSKSIQDILTTKDSSFNERFRSTVKDTFEAHWKKNMVKSKVANTMETSSGMDNGKGPLVIADENHKADNQSKNQEEPMEVDEDSVTDQVKDKNGKKVQEGKRIEQTRTQGIIPHDEASSNKVQETIKKPNTVPALVIRRQGDSYFAFAPPSQVNGKHRLPATVNRPVYNRPVNIFEPQPFMKNARDSSA